MATPSPSIPGPTSARLDAACRCRRALGGALLALGLGWGIMAFAADEAVTLNFVNADIDAVVKAVSEITGRNFVLDPKVRGTINIISARPVPRSLVYPTLLSALRLQGFAVVEADGIVKIVPEADAKMQGGTVTQGPVAGGGDRLITQVVTLKYESAQQLVNVLRPLITPNNTIAAFPGSNALVITDYASNLKRVDRIIASLDQPPAGEPIVVPVRHASAIDLVPLLNRLLVEPAAAGAPGVSADAQQRITLVADPRSNAILVRADNPGRIARLRQLIEQLDTPGRSGGNMFIVYLRNAEASRVAQTLRAMLTGAESAAPLAGGGLSSPATLGSTAQGAGGAMAPLATAVASVGQAGGATGQSFSANGATITADTASNALVIMAPEPVYNNLRTIIEKLDVRRAQVFVEALICEVSADKAAEFGIQWQALSGYNTTQTRVVGGTNFTPRSPTNSGNIIDIAVNPGSAGQGLNLGVMRGTVNIPGLGIITNLGFLARALETQVNANILSTPTLLTLDNEPAQILIGQNIPILTGSYATTGNTSTVNPFQTYERKDVGLVLRVKPQITEGGTVRLVLYQEVSRVDQSASTRDFVVLSKRVLESSVIVDDNSIVVLGGLIEDRLADGTDKVPLLGDIPLAGALFRYDARARTKTNLLVFLKPTVLRTDADGRAIASERYDYLMGEQARSVLAERLFWNDPTQPQLPPPGVMPGTPQSVPPPPATPTERGGFWTPPEPTPPGAPAGKP